MSGSDISSSITNVFALGLGSPDHTAAVPDGCPCTIAFSCSVIACLDDVLFRLQAPFYRLVAIDSRDRRDGRPIEYLGWYDPLKKETNLNAPAIKKWLQVGAQPSDTVKNLLKKAYVIQPDAVKVDVPRVEL